MVVASATRVACTPHTNSKRRNPSHCTCICGSESHGGLTLPVLDGFRFRVRLAAPSRFACHGGLTPAALVNVRSCTANVAFRSEVRCAPRLWFSPANRHCATRSGGRKPPVEKCLSRRPESHICNSVRIRNQKRGSKPPVECSRHTSSIRGNSSHCTCRCGSVNHGGLTPAALDGVRLPPKLALPSASRSADHGGLTPAALDGATRSGGRKPPVEHTPHTSSKRRNSSDCTCTCGS
jgi:hypothetical protein